MDEEGWAEAQRTASCHEAVANGETWLGRDDWFKEVQDALETLERG